MSSRMDKIIALIEAEACGRKAKDRVSVFHSVYVELGLQVGEKMRPIRQEERDGKISERDGS